MPEWSTISLFVVAASVLVIIPGPNTIYIITRSLQQGSVAGIVSCSGVMIGTLLHVTAAALGLSALVLSSTFAFNVVKFAGAAYLVYLGVRTLLTKENISADKLTIPEARLKAVFVQGIVVNVLNPKTALFIAAFLPQFITVGQEAAVTSQIFFFGAVLVVIGGISDMTYALLAGRVAKFMQKSPLPQIGGRYLAGCVYIGLGTATALAGANHK